MQLLYISYWGLNDPLTISSVMPTLPALKGQLGLDRLTLVTVERRGARYPRYDIPYDFVDHIPIEPRAQGSGLLTKAYEMFLMPRKIERICVEERIDLIFARCSLAGTIACRIHERTGIPFIVESFEPHADYMVNCGTWAKGGWKYRFARKFEKRQMVGARMLITVARSYRDYLETVECVEPSRLAVIPCVTDLDQTRFEPERREALRKELGLGDAVTGVYAGKFGDLYYDDEAFRIMRDAFEYFPEFRMVLLTPTGPEHIRDRITEHGIPEDRVHVRLVPRRDVPGYLSAADFAYSFHRPNPFSRFLCPIKHGEYWACGLPFIVPDGVSDDSEVIVNEGGGAVLYPSLTNLRDCHEAIARIVAKPDYRASIRQLAVRHKGVNIIHDVFSEIFGPPSD
ncbi:MAG: glycosyltransferase [Fimbriimonadaceae bacterium]|nr:glycosyltransferase [Fimbriimonadaceae bacterium]